MRDTDAEARMPLSTGVLTREQTDLMLRHLPIDITFVDENDTVAYYSDSRDRVFARSPAVIGRKVQDCHPPKSVAAVEQILNEFHEGARNVAEFWMQHHGRFVLVRYIAVREDRGRYRGCLEVAQDVTGVRALKGEKRLLDR